MSNWVVIREAAKLATPLPQRLQHRIRKNCLKDSRWRHEHTSYGPLDKVFNLIFAHPDFIVKPQPLIRPQDLVPDVDHNEPDGPDNAEDEEPEKLPEDDEPDDNSNDSESFDNVGNVSIDSYGFPVANVSLDKRFPDFAVCRLGSQPRDPDTLLLLIEIKAQDSQLGAAKIQITDYIDLLGIRAPEGMKCMAIAGKKVQFATVQRNTKLKWEHYAYSLGSYHVYDRLQEWAKAWEEND
ncbi:hypothetical protein AX16_008258 [Volvariella volvacea WC 439]|nr:hypothetical protein AX16_008258 [Volvariella volvacea WC 439]